MTRFELEIMGKLGEWWQKDAEKRALKMVEQAKTEAVVEDDGAIKWRINGRYLPSDCCAMLEWAGYDFDSEATAVKRDKQAEEFFAEYIKRQKEYDNEELSEMRSVFGPGAVVVDVITGKRVRV